jgi:hypothetical protein
VGRVHREVYTSRLAPITLQATITEMLHGAVCEPAKIRILGMPTIACNAIHDDVTITQSDPGAIDKVHDTKVRKR